MSNKETRPRGVTDAAPVVTGASDEATVAKVFAKWRSDPKLQAQFNAYVELDVAREIRDQVVRRFILHPHALSGPQTATRRQQAQIHLARSLKLIRKWKRSSVQAYMGISIDEDKWGDL